jgi:YebC/PmpR family DNA-binding regulatory protein
MAGHNKWSKVKHIKGAVDAKRAKIFSKLSREIFVAVKEGASDDPDLNPRLRMVLLKARQANMPSDNVQRAIQKATGEGGHSVFLDLTYEIYGPQGVAIMAEISTDNKNRTAAEIRHILTKHGGAIASAGSVTRLFHRKGQIMIARDTADEEKVMEVALEAGAEDFNAEEEGYEILTEPAQFEEVLKAVESAGIATETAMVTCLPVLMAPVPAEAAESIQKLIDTLEDHDDVKDIYSNAEFPDED